MNDPNTWREEDMPTNDAHLYNDIWEDAHELFRRKSKDYTNSNGQVFEDSGLLGQYMKLSDKIKKLKKPMWDAEIVRQAELLSEDTEGFRDSFSTANFDLGFEGAEEIMMDIMGHCILAISILRKREADVPSPKRAAEKKREGFSRTVINPPPF